MQWDECMHVNIEFSMCVCNVSQAVFRYEILYRVPWVQVFRYERPLRGTRYSTGTGTKRYASTGAGTGCLGTGTGVGRGTGTGIGTAVQVQVRGRRYMYRYLKDWRYCILRYRYTYEVQV